MFETDVKGKAIIDTGAFASPMPAEFDGKRKCRGIHSQNYSEFFLMSKLHQGAMLKFLTELTSNSKLMNINLRIHSSYFPQ